MVNIEEMDVIDLKNILLTRLNEWYSNNSFEILHKIFEIDYLFDLKDQELEDELDSLREEWYQMSIEDKIFIYKRLELY